MNIQLTSLKAQTEKGTFWRNFIDRVKSQRRDDSI